MFTLFILPAMVYVSRICSGCGLYSHEHIQSYWLCFLILHYSMTARCCCARVSYGFVNIRMQWYCAHIRFIMMDRAPPSHSRLCGTEPNTLAGYNSTTWETSFLLFAGWMWCQIVPVHCQNSLWLYSHRSLVIRVGSNAFFNTFQGFHSQSRWTN